ncbi:cell division ATP-binding protein FtsE [Candidatus Saccharibacteria bacterium]|nr:cell division ATP-binding protein FtsE [Candidatus Saccharibacteria bacterium]
MILLDSVTKRYSGDAEPALDNVSLHIEPNEFVFLVGKSGAGKSTLIKMLTKEETPDSGKIIVGGIDLDYVKKRHVPGYRRRLGVVFQDFKLLPRRTVYENVAFALEIMGMSSKDIRKTVPKVLELVDLLDQANKFPGQLSGGQQQRVSIARSVARQPKILIADEPTGQLDKLTTAEIIDLLCKINDFGTTILVTTHNENIVNNLQKRVVTLKKGRIVNDQKNNGIYKLDETPVPERPARILQAPGHALRRPLAFERPRMVVQAPTAKEEDKIEKVEAVKKPEKIETKKEVKMSKALKPAKEKKEVLKAAAKKPSAPRVRTKTMPSMTVRTAPKKVKIAKSNVI